MSTDVPRYELKVVAEMVSIHPDTLRKYERRGLLGSGRQRGQPYSERDVLRVRRIVSVTTLGINLAGADVVCNLLERAEEMQAEMDALRDQVRRLLET